MSRKNFLFSYVFGLFTLFSCSGSLFHDTPTFVCGLVVQQLFKVFLRSPTQVKPYLLGEICLPITLSVHIIIISLSLNIRRFS
jgi:hypothetical protein